MSSGGFHEQIPSDAEQVELQENEPVLENDKDLLPLIEERTLGGIEAGTVLKYDIEHEFVESQGFNFLVVFIPALAKKPEHVLEKYMEQDNGSTEDPKIVKQKKKKLNPFLPHHDKQFVCNISTTHKILLNKYAVSDNHILVITREFDSQLNALNVSDLDGFLRALRCLDGIGYFNAGPDSGASQPHKHLQVIPKASLTEIPIEKHIKALDSTSEWTQLDVFKFHHFLYRFDQDKMKGDSVAEYVHSVYISGLSHIEMATGVAPYPENDDEKSMSYNFVCTLDWMLLVPRSRDEYLSYGLNSIAFVGTVLTKTHEQLEELKEIGPMIVFEQVTFPREKEGNQEEK